MVSWDQLLLPDCWCQESSAEQEEGGLNQGTQNTLDLNEHSDSESEGDPAILTMFPLPRHLEAETCHLLREVLSYSDMIYELSHNCLQSIPHFQAIQKELEETKLRAGR